MGETRFETLSRDFWTQLSGNIACFRWKGRCCCNQRGSISRPDRARLDLHQDMIRQNAHAYFAACLKTLQARNVVIKGYVTAKTTTISPPEVAPVPESATAQLQFPTSGVNTCCLCSTTFSSTCFGFVRLEFSLHLLLPVTVCSCLLLIAARSARC